MEAACRLLAAIFTWCGVVGFALYVVWVYDQPGLALTLLREAVFETAKAVRGTPLVVDFTNLAEGQFYERAWVCCMNRQKAEMVPGTGLSAD